MKIKSLLASVLSATFSTLLASAPVLAQEAVSDLRKPILSSHAAKWLAPAVPFQMYGNTYFVGFAGLSMVLIQSDVGLVLIDGALPQSVDVVEEKIRQLGFRVEDIKFILSTEPHFDHAGGIAALAQDSGAVVVASPWATTVLRSGKTPHDDPQVGDVADAPPIKNVRAIGDGEVLQLGSLKIKAHFTPGHTPGSTSWSWVSCENGRCLNMVFASSLTSISTDHFHFTDTKNEALIASFRKSFAKVAQLPCDILISGHPEHSDSDLKIKALTAESIADIRAGKKANPFINPQACKTYANEFSQFLDERLAREKKEEKSGSQKK